MKEQTTSNAVLLQTTPSRQSTCRSIFGKLSLIALTVVFFAACGPEGGTTKNYYETKTSGGGGTGDGGGGQGVQCSDGTLYVRDIYEAIFEDNKTMKPISPDSRATDKVTAQARKVLAESLKKYFGPSADIFNYTTENYWLEVENHISFLEDDRELLPSQDANSPIKLKAGCSIVQIAYWDESARNANNDRLYVSRKLWKKLDQLNKIALLAHEIFFKQARIAGYKNSDAIRDQVGQLLSIEGLNTLFPQWNASNDSKVSAVLPASTKGFKVCDGTSQEDPNGRIRLYQYEGKDGKQHFSFPVISSTKITGAYLQGATASFSPGEDAKLDAATDLWVFQTDVDNEEPERFRLDTLDRWYSDVGFISDTTVVTSLLSKLGDTKTIWSVALPSANDSIKISIDNSLLNWGGLNQTKLRSPRELITIVNQELKQSLERCEQNNEATEGAIALLHKEIKTAVKLGKYPSLFREWTKALNSLQSKNSEQICADITQNSRVRFDLPSFLYSVYLKTNTEFDAQKVLGDRAFSDKKYSPLPLGKITISQGAEQLTLNLRCEDYKTQYANIATKSVSKRKTLQLGKQIVTAFPEDQHPSFTAEQKVIAQYFGQFLSQPEGSDASESFKKFAGRWNDENTNFGGHYSSDTRVFLGELSNEKNLRLSACNRFIEDYQLSNSPDLFGTACVVITMGSTNNSYTTYITYYKGADGKPDSIAPELEFVRFLPPPIIPAQQ